MLAITLTGWLALLDSIPMLTCACMPLGKCQLINSNLQYACHGIEWMAYDLTIVQKYCITSLMLQATVHYLIAHSLTASMPVATGEKRPLKQRLQMQVR